MRPLLILFGCCVMRDWIGYVCLGKFSYTEDFLFFSINKEYLYGPGAL